jgi:hypothetical protein
MRLWLLVTGDDVDNRLACTLVLGAATAGSLVGAVLDLAAVHLQRRGLDHLLDLLRVGCSVVVNSTTMGIALRDVVDTALLNLVLAVFVMWVGHLDSPLAGFSATLKATHTPICSDSFTTSRPYPSLVLLLIA